MERGHKEYEKVLFRSKDMSEAMYELSLLAGNGYTQELTAYEKTRLVERTKVALIRAKKEDGLEIKGKMRDLIYFRAGRVHERRGNRKNHKGRGNVYVTGICRTCRGVLHHGN